MRYALVLLMAALPALASAQTPEVQIVPPQAVLDPMGPPDAFTVRFDVGFLNPRLQGQMRTPSRLFSTATAPVLLPLAEQEWLAAPRITLEGLLDPGLGSLRGSFRYLGSEGFTVIPAVRQGGQVVEAMQTVRTIFDMPDVMGAYLTPSLLAGQELRAGVGVRFADVFIGSKARGNPTLETSVGSFWIGAGPMLLAEWDGRFGTTGLGWHVAGVGGPMFGQIRQRFFQSRQGRTSVTVGRLDTTFLSHTVTTAGVEAGLTWSATLLGRPVKLTAAYTGEEWWQVGRLRLSDGRLTLQGVVLRAEMSF